MWVLDFEAEERRKDLVDHPAPPPADLSVDAMRVEMLQGALTDAQQALVAEAETLVAVLRARLADRDGALPEKDARIAQLERQLAAAAPPTSWPFPAPELNTDASPRRPASRPDDDPLLPPGRCGARLVGLNRQRFRRCGRPA